MGLTKKRTLIGTVKPGEDRVWRYRCEVSFEGVEPFWAKNTDEPYIFAKLYVWWKVITYRDPKPPKSYKKVREL